MKIDSTLNLTVILAIVALISPVITTLLNNYHSYKIKELDVKQNILNDNNKHIKYCFEEFLSTYGRYTGVRSRDSLGEMKSSFYKCIPYIPNKDLHVFIDFYDSVVNENLKEARDKLENNLIPLISDIVSKLK